MKYNVIQIKPNRERWTAYVEEVSMDRALSKTVPNANGFYYFPSTVSKNKAFDRLKRCMIKRHKLEIHQLQRSLAALERVTLK
jgi:hypothetical protein